MEKFTTKKWIITYESFRQSKQEKLFESLESWEKKFIVWANKQTNKELALSLMNRFYNIREYSNMPEVKRTTGRLAGQYLPSGDFNSYESAEQMEKNIAISEVGQEKNRTSRGRRESMF